MSVSDVPHPHFLGDAPDPELAARAACTILPVPYDGTSSWHKGSDRGPEAILRASAHIEYYDIETDSEPAARGIATLPPLAARDDPESMCADVERAVAAILDAGRLPVVLGGEHSVTIGAVRAVASRYQNLSVLQIDAHGDTRDSYQGSPYNHACVMARAREQCPIMQVGIRAIDRLEMDEIVKREERDRIVFAHDILAAPDNKWMNDVVDRLTDDVYLTFDLDAFDPAILPATGTPEPGGLDWRTVNELIRRVAARRRIRGFDVVELCPREGHHASEFTAAKLVYRILAMVLASQLS